MKKLVLLEWGHTWTYDELHGKEWADVADEDSPPPYHQWSAALLNPPNEKAHGGIGPCKIVGGKSDAYRGGHSSYTVFGFYNDGTVFEQACGAIREVASYYMKMHRLSPDMKEWDALEADGFKRILKRGNFEGTDLTIISLKNSAGYSEFWLATHGSPNDVEGPFSSKMLARMYAFYQEYEMKKSNAPRDKVEPEDHITYPVYAFKYKFRNVDCVDIVCAETLLSAMKNFDFQWHVFDNTRPTKMSFNTPQDLLNSLRFLGFKDIKIVKLVTTTGRDQYIALAQLIGNPSTNPLLKRYCRNPKFRYLLGIDVHTGRSPVIINY